MQFSLDASALRWLDRARETFLISSNGCFGNGEHHVWLYSSMFGNGGVSYLGHGDSANYHVVYTSVVTAAQQAQSQQILSAPANRANWMGESEQTAVFNQHSAITATGECAPGHLAIRPSLPRMPATTTSKSKPLSFSI